MIVVALFAFAVGVAVAAAEPAVRIFAFEVDEVSSGSMRKRLVVATVAVGVGLALSLSVVRIESGWALATILIPGYLLVLALTPFVPRKYVPVAFDAGAVATGPVAVNFVLPLTTGLALGLWGEGAGLLGFGVVGIIALEPILGQAGAEGATIVRGRGTGVHESAKFLGVPIEPEKDMLFVLIPKEATDAVLDAMIAAGNLDEPGKGIAFVLDVPRVAGIAHRGDVVT